MKALVVLASLTCLLAGCGIQEVAEDTLDAVGKGNETQQKLLQYMRKTHELTRRIEGLNGDIADGIHRQTLAVSLAGMLNPENTKVLNPPFRMMPFAETFAKEATEDELVQTFYVLLQEVKFAPAEYEQVRMVSLVAMSALAAFCPTEKFHRILELQIDGRGTYEETAYAMGACRFFFIQNLLIRPNLDASASLNRGILRETVRQLKNMSQLVLHPKVKQMVLKVKSLNIEFFVDPSQLDLGHEGSLLQIAHRRFLGEGGLSSDELTDPEVQQLLKWFQSGGV